MKGEEVFLQRNGLAWVLESEQIEEGACDWSVAWCEEPEPSRAWRHPHREVGWHTVSEPTRQVRSNVAQVS